LKVAASRAPRLKNRFEYAGCCLLCIFKASCPISKGSKAGGVGVGVAGHDEIDGALEPEAGAKPRYTIA